MSRLTKANMTRTRKRHVALHEAGHAVIAEIHGVRIEFADMEGTAEFEAFVRTDITSEIYYTKDHRGPYPGVDKTVFFRALKNDAKVSLAGPVIDKIEHRRIAMNDIRAAEKYVAVLEQGKGIIAMRKRMKILREETLLEVMKHWDAIVRVQNLFLCGKRYFTEGEIREALWLDT